MSTSLDFSNVRIVLVNTSHPGNIGATARAMKNMGLSQLTLVAPKQFPHGVAVDRAASAVDILEKAVVVPSLEAAIADCGLVIGTSARSRSIPLQLLLPEQCAEKVVEDCRLNKVALVFGREDSGLSNEELGLCHFHVQIPSSENYSSLNLAAAVLVICYELRRAFMRSQGEQAHIEDDYWDIAKATGEQVEHFHQHLEQVLVKIDFHDPKNPRQLLPRLRRMFGRIRLDIMEMNILRGILAHVEHHIKEQLPAAKGDAVQDDEKED